MRSLKRPQFTAIDVLKLCVESIRDTELGNRLAKVGEEVGLAETNYIQLGNQQELFTISPTVSIGEVSVNEMKRVFKGTFTKSTRTRNIYDTLKKQPVNDICPMCGQRTVGSIDHYLPQSLHSALVVVPVNLVPACSDCNKAKLDTQPKTASTQTLHPYFDNVDEEKWLFADVIESQPASLRFYPDPPARWPTIMQERVHHHFSIFGLGALYASHSGEELTNIQYGLQRIAERGTAEQIRSELRRQAKSAEAANINSWRTAMYYALSESDWFCASWFS